MTQSRFERSRIAQPPVSEWKTLLALAYDGSWNAYQLSKQYEMRYPVTHRALKGLRKLGWVKVIGKELTIKNVKATKYGLTSEGVLWLFAKRPRESPPGFIEGLWKKGERAPAACQDEGETINAVEEAPSANSDIVDSVRQIVTQEDVYMHLLFDLDVDRIAEKNTQLFPTVFGPLEIHKKASIWSSIEFFLPEFAFSTLSECCYGYEGLFEKYGAIDQVLAYEIYRKVIENEASIPSAMDLGSVGDHVERIWRWAQQVSEAFPQFTALYEDIALDMEKRFTESLSFTKKILYRFTDGQKTK